MKKNFNFKTGKKCQQKFSWAGGFHNTNTWMRLKYPCMTRTLKNEDGSKPCIDPILQCPIIAGIP